MNFTQINKKFIILNEKHKKLDSYQSNFPNLTHRKHHIQDLIDDYYQDIKNYGYLQNNLSFYINVY